MKAILITVMLLILGSSCSANSKITTKSKLEKQHVEVQSGEASWYSSKCNGGRKTASGIKLVDHASTAAHKTLPFGTRVKVTNSKNGKSEIVKITDRGPYKRGRIIDVTAGVAQRLGFKSRGVTKVKLEVLK